MKIRSIRKGELFEVKNFKFNISGKYIKLTVDISGNINAGKSYVRAYMKRLFNSVKITNNLIKED